MEACGFGTNIFEAVKPDSNVSSGSQAGMDQASRRGDPLPYGIIVAEFQKGRVIAILKWGALGMLAE